MTGGTAKKAGSPDYSGDVSIIEERVDFRHGRQIASSERTLAYGLFCMESAETWIEDYIRKLLREDGFHPSPFASYDVQQETGPESVAQLRFVALTPDERRERLERTLTAAARLRFSDWPGILLEALILLGGIGTVFAPYVAAFLAGIVVGRAFP